MFSELAVFLVCVSATVRAIAFRLLAEATNSSAYRSMKLFSSEVWSVFVVPKLPGTWVSAAGISGNDNFNFIRSELFHPDLTYVPEHCTASVNNDMWGHQLAKLGLETWTVEGQK